MAKKDEITVKVKVDAEISSLQDACRVVVTSLKTNDEFYTAFVASIESALRESAIVWEEWEYTETAKKIADRIIGNESTSR